MPTHIDDLNSALSAIKVDIPKFIGGINDLKSKIGEIGDLATYNTDMYIKTGVDDWTVVGTLGPLWEAPTCPICGNSFSKGVCPNCGTLII